jgi:hypothetical protein
MATYFGNILRLLKYDTDNLPTSFYRSHESPWVSESGQINQFSFRNTSVQFLSLHALWSHFQQVDSINFCRRNLKGVKGTPTTPELNRTQKILASLLWPVTCIPHPEDIRGSSCLLPPSPGCVQWWREPDIIRMVYPGEGPLYKNNPTQGWVGWSKQHFHYLDDEIYLGVKSMDLTEGDKLKDKLMSS